MPSHDQGQPVQWAEHRIPYPPEATILDLFHARVAQAPGRTAIVFGAERLTYAELDGKANALAADLAGAGVRPGDLIPLLVGNELSLPLSALALMKLAAPFVPLDESWPAARIDTILDELSPPVVVCSRALTGLTGLGPPGVRPVLVVDSVALSGKAAPVDTPGPTGDDLIYGFYTSGSTGRPKCALNAHLGLLNRFLAMSRRFAADGGIVLQNSRHVFDSSIWQLLWPLTTGGTVVIPVRDGILDLAETVSVIARHGVTMTDFVPSIFNTLVEMLGSDPRLRTELRSLRRVLIGGEEVSPRAIGAFRELMPDVRLTNTYGPTECSIGSVFHEIDGANPIPIGLPIENTVAVVLRDDLRPAAAGEHGEIYIGGDCVGRGYLNDPEKTASAFVPNPFASITGPLLYRTGDRGWADTTGLLYFAGRFDHQVKLSGVRVELSEVESALARHPLIREAKAVVAGEESRQRLVAFVLTTGPVVVAELTGHVASLLPAVSVPKDIIVVAEFPLTLNGKADRRALAAMATVEVRADQITEPAGETERRIRAIWADLLATPAISTTVGFFDAGGDSLIAHRLAAALRPLLGRTPGVRELVAHPTIRAQAALVDGVRPEASPVPVPSRLREDAVLPAGTRRVSEEPWAVGTVLLTGATGFVGAHLLVELLARTSARIVCLVRAADRGAAQARVLRAVESYGLSARAVAHRVEALPGDLAAAGLGLGRSDYDWLAATVGTVVHSGAMVNLLLGYDALRPANVGGTREILRLMATGRRKHLHHISTLGVFPAAAPGGHRIAEDVGPLDSAIPSEGYAQSKWVAERLVLLARGRGIESSVYRLGEVGPHSGTGVPSDHGLVDSLLYAAAAHGVYPETAVSIDCTPVDYVTRLVVAAVVRGRVGATFHAVQPAGIELGELFGALARQAPVRQVSYGSFWRELGQAGEAGLRLRTLLPEPAVDPASGVDSLAEVFSDASRRFARDNAAGLSAEAGIVLPPRDVVLDRYAAGCLRRVDGDLDLAADRTPFETDKAGVH
jgi:amino acid adenylation domain-containing protein/thioester reductase-like protein